MTTNPDLAEAVENARQAAQFARGLHERGFSTTATIDYRELELILAAVTPPLRGGEELGLSVAESAALPQEARPANASDDLLDALINVLNDLAPIDYDDEVLEPGSDARVAAYWLRPSVVRAREAIANAEGR